MFSNQDLTTFEDCLMEDVDGEDKTGRRLRCGEICIINGSVAQAFIKQYYSSHHIEPYYNKIDIIKRIPDSFDVLSLQMIKQTHLEFFIDEFITSNLWC